VNANGYWVVANWQVGVLHCRGLPVVGIVTPDSFSSSGI